MTKLLALDQSTTVMGFSIYEEKKLLGFGYVDFESYSSCLEERINAVKHFVMYLIETHQIDTMAIEDTQLQQNPETFKSLSKLLGVVENVAIEQKIPYEILKASEWRGFCKIKGRARAEQKRNARIYVDAKYNIKSTEDMADAICLGEHAVNKATMFSFGDM